MASEHRVPDTWERANPYERYIGRWSRGIAPQFLAWLNVAPGARWVDVGCGTGALSAAILGACAPRSVMGIDPSKGFLALARESLGDRATFAVGDASAIPLADDACDVLVS